MNTRLSFLLSLAAITAFSSPGFSAPASPSGPPKAYTVTIVERHNATLIERGMTEFAVRRSLGEASRKLDRNHWIYLRFEALPNRPANEDCSTLLIVFAEGKVVDLKLLNDRAETVITANLKSRADGSAVASAR